MKSILLSAILACSIGLKAQKVRVAAAADLRFAMDEVVDVYKKLKPSADIEVSYGSSGNVFTQIKNGAPYDVYFSADISLPQKLHDEGFTLAAPILYAIGRIVLWSSAIDVSNGMQALSSLGRSRLAIANPSHAPYGQRAEEALRHYKLYDQVKSQIIMGENISQAAQFCLSGNADIGILALSLVLSPTMSGKGKYYLIEESAHQPLRQGAAVIKSSKNIKEAQEFLEFTMTGPARAVFEKYGFTLP
jgi:molybdate transport system substrate-binding protein